MHFSLISRSFLSPDSIRLGRFVRNIEEPHSDFLDPDFPVSKEATIVQTHLQYSALQQNEKEKSSFTAMLTSLVSASRTKRNKACTQICSDQAKTYRLSNSGAWFRSAVKSEATREWIREYIDQGDDIYVVVGYHTITDAKVVEGAEDATNTDAWLKLPMQEALAATGVGVSLGDIADPAVKV